MDRIQIRVLDPLLEFFSLGEHRDTVKSFDMKLEDSLASVLTLRLTGLEDSDVCVKCCLWGEYQESNACVAEKDLEQLTVCSFWTLKWEVYQSSEDKGCL